MDFNFDSGGVIKLEFLEIRVINCRNFGCYSLGVVIGTIMFVIVIRYDGDDDVLSVDCLLIFFR